jgi:hypothetical protein
MTIYEYSIFPESLLQMLKSQFFNSIHNLYLYIEPFIEDLRVFYYDILVAITSCSNLRSLRITMGMHPDWCRLFSSMINLWDLSWHTTDLECDGYESHFSDVGMSFFERQEFIDKMTRGLVEAFKEFKRKPICDIDVYSDHMYAVWDGDLYIDGI